MYWIGIAIISIGATIGVLFGLRGLAYLFDDPALDPIEGIFGERYGIHG